MVRDPLRTKLCSLLGVELPIISFTHCREVAAAVINAGGFAVLGEAMCTPDEIAADIRWLREHLDGRPFGIDLVLPTTAPPSGTPGEFLAEIPETHRQFARQIKEKYDVPEPRGSVALHRWGGLNREMGRAQADLLLEERVPVIASGLGSPGFFLDAAHERGLLVFGLVGRTRQARRQLELGVDAIVAQGYDAAGHTGATGTFSIVPEIASIAGDTPVLAAGGVTTGRHVAAALCLGAAGVWTGTVWLASVESDVDPLVKQRILAATADDTLRSRAISGKSLRVLRCPWTEEWSKPEAPPVLATPYQMLLSSDYIQAANDHRRADLMTEAVGQGVGFVKEMKPARQILREMVEEARTVLTDFTAAGS